MHIVLAIAILGLPTCVLAQQVEEARVAGAAGFLIQQRNGALDNLALCSFDLQVAQKRLAEIETELEKLKKEKKQE
jgi:hypothetical protein